MLNLDFEYSRYVLFVDFMSKSVKNTSQLKYFWLSILSDEFSRILFISPFYTRPEFKISHSKDSGRYIPLFFLSIVIVPDFQFLSQMLHPTIQIRVIKIYRRIIIGLFYIANNIIQHLF